MGPHGRGPHVLLEDVLVRFATSRFGLGFQVRLRITSRRRRLL